MTKKQLTAKVKEYVLKSGMKIIINQTDRPKRKQESNNPDYFIYGKGKVIFLEAKIGRDKLSEGQSELMNELQWSMKFNRQLYADVITDKNYIDILNKINNL